MDLYDCIEFDNIIGKIKNHPNEKPQNILMYFLQLFNYQNKKDFNIFDPFMGGGSLAKACQKFNTYINNNINYIGTELDKHYFENAKEMIESNFRVLEFELLKKDKNEKTLLNFLEG